MIAFCENICISMCLFQHYLNLLQIPFKMFKKILVTIFLPFNSLNYLIVYHNLIRQSVVLKNKKLIYKIYFINFLIFLKSLHFLYIGLAPLNELTRIFHFDAFYLILPKSFLNLMATLCCMLAIFYNQMLLVNVDYNLNCLLYRIIIKGDDAFFTNKYDNCKLVSSKVKVFYNYILKIIQTMVWCSGTNQNA